MSTILHTRAEIASLTPIKSTIELVCDPLCGLGALIGRALKFFMPFVVPGLIVKASHIRAWPLNSEIHRLFTLRNTKIWQFPVPPQSRSVPSGTSPGLLPRSTRFARSSVFHKAGMSYASFSNIGTSWLTSFPSRFCDNRHLWHGFPALKTSFRARAFWR